MEFLFNQHRQALLELCKRFRVARLELFGSAAKDSFNADSSDLDFLVEFLADYPMGAFHQYFDFLAELEKLFGRKIDLVEKNAMRNPYFIRSANQQKVLLYAA